MDGIERILSLSRSRRGSLFLPACPPWRGGWGRRRSNPGKDVPQLSGKVTLRVVPLFVFDVRRASSHLHVDADAPRPAEQATHCLLLPPLSQVSALPRLVPGCPMETIKVGGGRGLEVGGRRLAWTSFCQARYQLSVASK